MNDEDLQRFGYSSDELISFFVDEQVDERMTLVRDSIMAIRKDWHRYDELVEDARTWLLEHARSALASEQWLS